MSSRGNSVGYRQMFSQLRSTTAKVGGEGGFDGRRPKSSNKHKQQQKQRQQQAATGTQATRKAATCSRIRSNTNSTNKKPETVRAKRCGSRKWGGVHPWNFVRLWSRFFSVCKLLVIGFSEVLREGKSIVKLLLTFCKSHRGFTRQPVSPYVHSWYRPLQTQPKFHEKTPTERKKERKWEQERKKRGEILGGPAEGSQGERPNLGRTHENFEHTPHQHTTTTQHNNNRGIPHKVVLGKGGPSQGGPWPKKNKT